MKVLYLYIIASYTAVSSHCDSDAISCPSSSTDYCCTPNMGLIVLAQQWNTGIGPSDSFTLHGLWPSYCNQTYLEDGCDKSRNYPDLEAKLKSDPVLIGDMGTFWPSYKGENSKFWSHEWNKHGTCISTLRPNCISDYAAGDDALNYFRMGLKLRGKYNLYSTLKEQNILPGAYYSLKNLESALTIFGGKPQLHCKSNVIQEVYLSFYVKGNGQLVSIDSFESSRCPKEVFYPIKGSGSIGEGSEINAVINHDHQRYQYSIGSRNISMQLVDLVLLK